MESDISHEGDLNLYICTVHA